MIIQFKRNLELNDRIHLAGQSYEFDEAQAAELIAGGNAVEAKVEPKVEPVEAEEDKPAKAKKSK